LFLGTQDNPPSLHRYLYGYANPVRYVDPTGHCVECPVELAGMTPEQRLAQAQEQTNAVARATGSLWGTAKWAAKTGWRTLQLALGRGGHEELGEAAVEAAQDPKKATQAYIDGKKREYDESLDRAQQHLLKGEHFAAGAGFTEEFTAPTAADAVIVAEGVGGLGRAAVRRTAPAVDRLRAAMQQTAEAQARESELAMARAIAAGRRSELGAAGRIMSDSEARAVFEGAEAQASGTAEASAYRLAKHGEMPTPRAGFESHHGALSRWMQEHFPGYDPNKAPAVLMPGKAHDATRAVYNRWRASTKSEMGGTFEWSKVSESQVRDLGEKMFQASKTPQEVQQRYWDWFERTKAALERQEGGR
jgi:hypothetical protein